MSLSDCIEGTTVVKAALDNVEQNLISSFSTMNEMAGQGLLIRGTDYDAIVDSGGDLVLRLNHKLFYDKFMLYCMRNNVQHIVFSLSEFKQILRTTTYCKCHNSPIEFVENVEKSYTRKILLGHSFMV